MTPYLFVLCTSQVEIVLAPEEEIINHEELWNRLIAQLENM